MLKIIFDKIVSSLLLLVCSPLFLLIGILIKITSAGPIIFKQRRVGCLGAEFTIYKFRTMLDNSGTFADLVLPGDKRVTEIGKFLRSTHLDELPQLWNIIKGEMSLIGPRPKPRELVDLEMHVNPEYAQLLRLRPGLTGPVQLRGRMWSLSNKTECFRINIEYLNSYSLLADLKILIRTFGVIFKGQGV